jgi:hypothetical protein
MKQEQINRVRAAMKNQQAKGVKVIDGDWGVELDTAFLGWTTKCNEPCACAMGCLLLEEQPSLLQDQEEAAATVLGATRAAIGAFTTGFDGEEPWPGHVIGNLDWYEAGRALRKEFGLADDDEAVA